MKVGGSCFVQLASHDGPGTTPRLAARLRNDLLVRCVVEQTKPEMRSGRLVGVCWCILVFVMFGQFGPGVSWCW